MTEHQDSLSELQVTRFVMDSWITAECPHCDGEDIDEKKLTELLNAAIRKHSDSIAAKARLEEAEWWQHYAGLGLCERDCKGKELDLCPYCKRITELKSRLEGGAKK